MSVQGWLVPSQQVSKPFSHTNVYGLATPLLSYVRIIDDYLTCHLVMLTDNCDHGEVRSPLLGGASESEGLVEVCVDGNYLPVSLDNGRFSVREATVICKQLGLGNGEPTASMHDLRHQCQNLSHKHFTTSWHFHVSNPDN